ncbi:MAG: hypothetical protein HY721_14080 [Planctomycetes bacterium]|nr:hypothetical protein [Planctomycetota bacterium]
MKTITLRNLPREIVRAVEQKARRERISLTKAVVRLLEEAAGLRKERKPEEVLHHDLDWLAGSWTKEEAQAFEGALQEQRKIDPELWK